MPVKKRSFNKFGLLGSSLVSWFSGMGVCHNSLQDAFGFSRTDVNGTSRKFSPKISLKIIVSRSLRVQGATYGLIGSILLTQLL